ncbi:MAG: MFS transporter [Rubrivivax sp.]|nr:MFS transporter [Rubrivivax sp.]
MTSRARSRHSTLHPDPEPPPRGALVATVLAQLAFGLLAMTICLPSMQQWGAIFGASQARVQLTFSGYVVAFGALQLLYGPLSDRLGRRRVLLAGLGLSVLGSLLAALATELTTLTVARVLQGAGTAAGTVVGRALVQDLFRGPDRTRVMGWVGMTMGLCPPTATLVGGYVHVHLGWQDNFVLIAALSLLLMVAALRWLPGRPTRPDAVAAADATAHPWWRGLLSSYARLAREPEFLLYVAVLALTTAAFYAFLSGAPLVLGSEGVGPERIGWYILFVPLSYIVGNFITTRLVRRLGERPIMWIGQGLTVGGLVLVLGLGLAGWHTPLAFAGPLLLMGAGHGLLMPPSLAGTVGVVPALAGAAAAVGGVMQQLMGAAGAYAVGWFGHQGPVNLALLMLSLTALAMWAQVMLFRRPARRT